jgi:hypothetical protein
LTELRGLLSLRSVAEAVACAAEDRGVDAETDKLDGAITVEHVQPGRVGAAEDEGVGIAFLVLLRRTPPRSFRPGTLHIRPGPVRVPPGSIGHHGRGRIFSSTLSSPDSGPAPRHEVTKSRARHQ